MPDAARLVAAMSLALLAYFATRQIIPLLPEGTEIGNFIYINAGIAVLVGWLVMGSRAGRGVTAALNNGLTGMCVLVFWGVALQGVTEMMRLAMNNRFDGPLEAIVAALELSAGYGLMIATPLVLGILIFGGMVVGLVTELAWRTLR